MGTRKFRALERFEIDPSYELGDVISGLKNVVEIETLMTHIRGELLPTRSSGSTVSVLFLRPDRPSGPNGGSKEREFPNLVAPADIGKLGFVNRDIPEVEHLTHRCPSHYRRVADAGAPRVRGSQRIYNKGPC